MHRRRPGSLYSIVELNQNTAAPFPSGCVFVTAGPSTKLFAWGGGDMGGHVLRETTSRGLCGLGCPSRTSERGGVGDCVKEGGGRRREVREGVDPQRCRFGSRKSDFQGDICVFIWDSLPNLYHPGIWRGHGRYKLDCTNCKSVLAFLSKGP
jgi:hypothetical protein